MDHRIMYLRDSKGQPVGCVAIKVVSDKLVTYQMSVLNPADRFNRAVARQLALGRLVAPLTARLPYQAINMHDITEAVCVDICNDKSAPSRARKAAKLWLNTRLYLSDY